MRLDSNRLLVFIFCAFMMGCNADIPSKEKATEEIDMFKGKTEKYVIFSPMEGVLMQNGKPLPNTRITRRLRWNGNDEGLLEEFSTDDQGNFSLPLHEESLSLGMLNQFVCSTKLEVVIEGEIYDVWYNNKFVPELYAETGGHLTELTCDLDFEEIPVYIEGSSVPNILTRCRWKYMPK